MKTHKFIFILFAVALFSSTQKIAAQAISPEQDNIRLAKTSLFQMAVKSENYADAVEPWEFIYENYPASTAYVYAYGTRILTWQISQAKSEDEKQALVKKLMKLYDDRITYFGTSKKQPTPWILGMKALDYITYHPNDALKKDAYNWLEQAITGLGPDSELAFLQWYVYLSTNIYLADKTHGEKYIQDYLKANDVLEEMIKATADATMKSQTEMVKKANDDTFASSGAANCNMLEEIFNKNLEANKSNMEWLNNTMGFFRRVKCTDSPTYTAAAVYAHNISPTAESANGVAQMAYLKKEYSKAISYFEEAAEMSDNKSDKAEAYYTIAKIYFTHMKNYPKTREYARMAIANKGNWGEPYMLIGMAYASSRNVFGDDAILNATVYWAAVDQMEKAKQVDPSVTGEANKAIANYKTSYPKKEDVFFKPELEPGKPFIVGGWINETVISR